MAFVSAGQFNTSPTSPSHILIIPRQHIENIYELSDPVAARIHALARRVALAIKRLGADGTSTRQHNEPAGNQDVWHFHLHSFPRYAGDALYAQKRVFVTDERRAAQATTIRAALTEVLAALPMPDLSGE